MKPTYEELEQQLAESHRALRAETTAHENLQMQVEKMTAELSAVEAVHNEAVFITDEHYDQCPPEVQKIIRSLAVMQIPAYQDFLAEVRAQGVEMFADHLSGMNISASETSVREFATAIRKGVQS